MTSVTVYCEDCDHVHPASRDDRRPWGWRCLMQPFPPGYKFLTKAYSPDPPYRRCEDTNTHGDCAQFAPRRQGAPDDRD